MIKEKYEINIEETSFSVAMSRLDSIRRKNITRTGYRVYKDGFIGVYGQLGQSDVDPWALAEQNLATKIAYPYAPASNIQQEKIIPASLASTEMIREIEGVLALARQRQPQFIFSNKINIRKMTLGLSNDQDTRLSFQDTVLSVGLILKHKDSVNIMDAFLSYRARHWDKEFFLAELDKIANAYNTELAMPEGDVVIVTEPGLLAGKLAAELNGEKIGFGSSLLAKDMGKKVFSDDFTFYLDWSEEDQYGKAFFDAEGTVIPEGRVDLIKNGVIEKAYTDKRTADRFSMPLTGSAASPYDGVPLLSAGNFNIGRSDMTLKQLLDGRPGIIVVIASGGDYTDEGRFAAPVQLGILTDGEKWLGRVPQFSISGNLYDIFGKNYLGYSKDRFLANEPALAVRMDLGS